MRFSVHNHTANPLGIFEVGKDQPTIIAVGGAARLDLGLGSANQALAMDEAGQAQVTALDDDARAHVAHRAAARPPKFSPFDRDHDGHDGGDGRKIAQLKAWGYPEDELAELTRDEVDAIHLAQSRRREPIEHREEAQRAMATEVEPERIPPAEPPAPPQDEEPAGAVIQPEDLDDDTLHAIIKEKAGKALPSNTGRDRLIERARELLASPRQEETI